MKVSALSKERSAFPIRNPQFAIRNLAVPTVDAVMVEERAASFGKRSIKTSAKLAGLKLAVSMCDLTTLEGKDTPGKIEHLIPKGIRTSEGKYGVPSSAAMALY